MPLPTIRDMRAMWVYDPQSPSCLVWRVRRGRQAAGKPVGTQKPNGYWVSHHYGYVHVLVWCLHHGRHPRRGCVVDHIDGDQRNNAITNLQELTKVKDLWKRQRVYRNNTNGFVGVYRHPNGRWRAQIMTNYKLKHLGYFDTAEEAAVAYRAAAINRV